MVAVGSSCKIGDLDVTTSNATPGYIIMVVFKQFFDMSITITNWVKRGMKSNVMAGQARDTDEL